jgi:hypothetical protein
LSVRFDTEMVWFIVGGHWRLAQPITRRGSPSTSFENALTFPAGSVAVTTT